MPKLHQEIIESTSAAELGVALADCLYPRFWHEISRVVVTGPRGFSIVLRPSYSWTQKNIAEAAEITITKMHEHMDRERILDSVVERERAEMSRK
jgi:hypothetical protein